MSDWKEYEITVIIRDKNKGVYSDSQQEEAVRTLVRDEQFNFSDTLDDARKKVKMVLDDIIFTDM